MEQIIEDDGEIWADIAGFPKYQVSTFGRVKSFRRGKAKLLTAFKNNQGYWRVALTDPFG